jgi:aryl-alcohol dehydrogenase-like predicted oxidoreductase
MKGNSLTTPHEPRNGLGRAPDRRSGRERDRDESRAVATDGGQTSDQVALAWWISGSSVNALPESKPADGTGRNRGASGWGWTGEQLRLLDEAFSD